MNLLELKIDQFGRILIPQGIRENLGLLEWFHSYSNRKSSVLVYTGKLESKKSFENWERQNREFRNQTNWGIS